MSIKIDAADALFSTYIRTRDNWTCQRCGSIFEPPTKALHNSHYFGRGREGTRFDPENCIALCHGCHKFWGSDNREEYREYMIKQIGEKEFEHLRIRSEQYCRKDRKASYIIAKKLLEELKNGAR